MSKPMLDIKKGSSNPQTVPHLLPCKVQYDGPVEPTQSFWNPGLTKGELPHPH